jgi:hypothetical protein
MTTTISDTATEQSRNRVAMDAGAIEFLETKVLPLVKSEGARALLLDAIETEKNPHIEPALRHVKQELKRYGCSDPNRKA